MSTPNDKVLDKIRRLLGLARSDNPHEAALAASKAQELMLKHAVDEAELERHGGDYRAEPMGNFKFHQDGKWSVRWHGLLATAMAKSFMVKTYSDNTGGIWVVGRTSHREVFAATFEHVRNQVAFLRDAGWKGFRAEHKHEPELLPYPRVWKTSFCIGAVVTIRERLQADLAALPQTGTSALVLRDRNAEAQAWANANLALRNLRATRISHSDGYHDGKAAGHSVNLERRAARLLGGGG